MIMTSSIHNSIFATENKKLRISQFFIESTEEDIENSALEDLSEDFLSSKELDYYLSLK